MIRRFQIEDLLVQDESGIVFRALDTETGKPVALRRFFPFGASGGGLQAEEQAAYQVALGRLAGLSHPAMRSIICGGCDPVDGMPFIATEWIEGESLASHLAVGPLPAQAATELITKALEVCELLSHVLAEDAVWIETDPQNIIIGNSHDKPGFTFWLCPRKWLGNRETSHRLTAMIDLTEKVMGWQGRKVNDQAGHGLAGWLKWMRHAEQSVSLHDARETLAAAVGVPPPPPVTKLVTRAPLTVSRAKPAPPSQVGTWFMNLCLAVIALGLGAWYLMRQQMEKASAPLTKPAAVMPTPMPPPAPTRQDAPEKSAAPEPGARPRPNDPAWAPLLREQQYAAKQHGGVIDWTSRELLLSLDKQKVVVEGVLEDITVSDQKTKMHLLWSKPPDKYDSRGVVLLKSAPADLTEEKLRGLIGKTVRLHGTVDKSTYGNIQRPEILIKDRASIKVVP